MTLNDLRKMGRILFEQNDIVCAKDRTLLNGQWASIGRGSDIGTLTFKDIRWMDGFFLGEITRRKVSAYQALAVFPSALMWEMDMLHSLGTQLVCEPFGASMLIFNQVGSSSSNESKIAAHINRVMKVIYLLITSTCTSRILFTILLGSLQARQNE